MNYDQYQTEQVEADHTRLGKLGVSESFVASAKQLGKKATGVVATIGKHTSEVGKIALPGIGHAGALAINAGLATRDAVSAHKTSLRGLRRSRPTPAPRRSRR